MNKSNYKILAILFITSYVIQASLNLYISERFMAALLTIFSIFFSFYFGSFVFFASSKYSVTLYKVQDRDDSGMTLLHTLMSLFESRTRYLFYTIIYIIFLYIMLINEDHYVILYLKDYLKGTAIFISPFNFLWGIIIFNIFYIMSSVSIFIKIIIKSIEEPE